MSKHQSRKRYAMRHTSNVLGIESEINPHKRQMYRKGYHMQEIPVFVEPNGDVARNTVKTNKKRVNATYKVCGVWRHHMAYKYSHSKFILHKD